MKEIVIVCLAIDDRYRDGQYSRFPLTLPLKSAGRSSCPSTSIATFLQTSHRKACIFG
jgi:hypothetical protein